MSPLWLIPAVMLGACIGTLVSSLYLAAKDN